MLGSEVSALVHRSIVRRRLQETDFKVLFSACTIFTAAILPSREALDDMNEEQLDWQSMKLITKCRIYNTVQLRFQFP